MTVDFDSAGSKVMRPSSFAHVLLKTNKFKEMVAFYKTLLDAEARFQNERIAFMCFDDEHHCIAIAAVPHTTDKVRTSAGLEHIAFGFKTIEDLLLAYRQRKAVGRVWHGHTVSTWRQSLLATLLELHNILWEGE
jgi:catechol-2,3-dioxygenase